MPDKAGPSDGPSKADGPTRGDRTGHPSLSDPGPSTPGPSTPGPSRPGPRAPRPSSPGPSGPGGPRPAGPGPAGQPPPALPAPDASLRAEIDAIVAGASHNPHAVLGAHPGPDGVVVRALRPLAQAVTVVLADGRRFPAGHLHEGVFAATLPVAGVPDYRLAVTYPGPGGAAGRETVADDPYRHLPTLGEMDLHMI